MSIDRYDIGDERRLKATFTDINDNAADPDTVTFKMLEPDATLTTYVYGTDVEVVKSGTGIYYVDWTITKKGRHAYRWEGAGTITTAEEDKFSTILNSNF